jgi:cytochrome P450
MREESESLVRSWHADQEVDIQQAVHDLTNRVTLRCFFSSDTSDPGAEQTVNDAAEALDEVGRGMFKQMTAPVAAMSKLPTQANRRYRSAVKRFNEAVDSIITRQRNSPRSGDLIGLLMAAHDDETDSTFSDVELRDQVVTFLGAGIDTTANLIAWSLGLLAENPETRARFLAEVDAHGGPQDPIEVQEMPYTTNVLNEALRLYPPLWSLMRVAKGPVELGGHQFPAGTTFGVSPYALQRDPRVIDDPAVFDPERRVKQPSLPRSSVIPFGAGTHKCIGDGFAMTEAVIALTTIARHWQLDLTAASSPLRPETRMTLGPANLTMRVTARG